MVQSCNVILNPNLKSCLVNLPRTWVSALRERSVRPGRISDIVLEVAWTESATLARQKIYLGWSGEAVGVAAKNPVQSSIPEQESIEFDAAFGQALGLKDKQRVTVEFVRPAPEAKRVDVEPISEDDWEILQLHAGYLEEKLLSQVRIVYPGQTLTVWVQGQAMVRLKVTSTDPSEKCVRLANDSEIVVAPRERRHKVNDQEEFAVADQPVTEMPRHQTTLRTLPLEYLEKCPLTIEDDFLCIGLHPSIASQFPDLIYILNTSSNPPQDESSGDGKEEVVPRLEGLYCKCRPVEKVPLDHVMLGPELRELLHAVPFDRLQLSTVSIPPISPKIIKVRRVRETRTFRGITIGGKKKTTQEEANQQLASDINTFLQASALPSMIVTDKMTCHVPLLSTARGDDFDMARVVLEFPPDANPCPRYALLSPDEGKLVKIEVGSDYVDPTETDKPTSRSLIPDSLPILGGVDPLLAKATEYLKTRLGCKVLKKELAAPQMGGLLIYGGHGSGKTSVVQHLVYTLSRSLDTLAYCLMMPCSDYSDDRSSKIKEHFEELFADAAAHAPSIVVFDDLDRIIMGEQEHMDTSRYKQLAAMFVDVAMQAKRYPDVVFVATVQNQSTLNPYVMESRVFDEVLHISPPTKAERKLILQATMSDGNPLVMDSLKTIDLTSIASSTEGYLAADLKTLVERAVHAAAVRALKQDPTSAEDFTLEQEDFETAQKGYVPSSLRGVKLQQSETSWGDIGGLQETRRVLKETLEWPTKYAAIFANSPLRLRSGLLLYGYPGCGKTLLASAVAKECGLNFISVKGPELLNKYIGASEAAVRDLFERAQAAKPCILFFDEFDAIAPRRGHDNTGVTDRVVNQLLTQMDGAEKVEGVYVLAATSRPDLIDPALLRPGRLDKSLLCGMPDEVERLDILNAVARKLDVDPELDLSEWAKKTEGYSGADLQALLYNAHLDAIHERMSDVVKGPSSGGNVKQGVEFNILDMKQLAKGEQVKPRMTAAEKGQWSTRLEAIQTEISRVNSAKQDVNKESSAAHQKTVIENRHVENAFATTRPSISPQDRQRFERIYQEFLGGRSAPEEVGKRSTLA